jgi:flagellar protein FlaF
MGFSVSGAAAIIFATMFVVFGMWYTATANSFEAVTDAEKERTDAVRDTKNTEIAIQSVTYDTVTDEVTVTVNNTGTAQLSVEDTDVLLDGQYQTGWTDNATVEGRDTRLWLSGETLAISITDVTTLPGRVKVATAHGVADITTEVTSI